jgi:serine O-acetyltransferase
MPSRKVLTGILDGLSAALFPNHLGLPVFTDEGVDPFVGHTLDVALRGLFEQVHRELQFVSGQEDSDSQREQAIEITHEFTASLPQVRTLLE